MAFSREKLTSMVEGGGLPGLSFGGLIRFLWVQRHFFNRRLCLEFASVEFNSASVMSRKPEIGWGVGELWEAPILPTGGECSDFNDYSMLNKCINVSMLSCYMPVLYAWCSLPIAQTRDYVNLPNFFHIIVVKIVKLVGSKFTNWISNILSILSISSVSWPNFTNNFPVVCYFIQLVGPNIKGR